MTRRTVIALVSTPSGFAGRTEQFGVESADWYHVEPVNEALERLLGVRTTVLRLVSVRGASMPKMGGLVTYHVEALGEPDRTRLRPAREPEADAEFRLPYARVGGPAELIEWADAVIDRTGPAVQVRTWNLSTVHRLPTAAGPVWLKAAPRFFADEAAVIGMIAEHDPTLVPEVIAAAPQRVLLGDAPSDKCWPVTPDHVDLVLPRWVAVQHALAGPPRIAPTTVPMPSFGLPDTLTHGDFHPGNWRTGGRIIDWGDAVWGHPTLDACRLIDYCAPEIRDHIADVWCDSWLALRPDSEPRRALDVGRRASHLHKAVKYQLFLDNIEQSERIYHEGDPQGELRAVRRLVR